MVELTSSLLKNSTPGPEVLLYALFVDLMTIAAASMMIVGGASLLRRTLTQIQRPSCDSLPTKSGSFYWITPDVRHADRTCSSAACSHSCFKLCQRNYVSRCALSALQRVTFELPHLMRHVHFELCRYFSYDLWYVECTEFPTLGRISCTLITFALILAAKLDRDRPLPANIPVFPDS